LLSAHYRAKLNFNWESLDGANKALDRLRLAAYEWGQPGQVNQNYLDDFTRQINDDLNLPRALAVTWDLARSDLSPATKKATLLEFDKILGLNLAQWQPVAEAIPAGLQALLEERQQARREKRWQDADRIRQEIIDAGYELEDTPQGPRLKRRKSGVASA